jgi:hypothetical protein
VCRGYIDYRWYPRYHTTSNEVQITRVSKANKSPAAADENSEASTVEVVTIRNDPRTPIPRYNSDDSSEGQSDATESEKMMQSSACATNAMTRFQSR